MNYTIGQESYIVNGYVSETNETINEKGGLYIQNK